MQKIVLEEIGKHINLLTGFPFKSSGYTNSGIRLLRGANVKRGKTDWSEDITKYWETLETEHAKYKLEAGDLVIAMDGSLVGRSFAKISATDIPALLLQRVARIRSTSTLDAGYLSSFIGSDWFTKHVDKVKTTTAIPHISPSDIKSFAIPIPSTIAEQQAIASTLSAVDALLAKFDQLIAKKRDIKQAAMQELLTGRRRLPGFSDVWRTQKLRDGISLLSGQHVLAEHCNTDEIGCPYITGPSDFHDGKIQHSKFTTSPTTLCQAEDILITVKGSGVGAMVMSDSTYCISRQLMAIRVESDWCNQFIHQLLQQDASLIGAAATGLIPGISRSDILNKEIHTPRAAEQTAIAAVLSDMDTEITALEARREKTRLIKQGMMQELLSGRVRLI